MPRFYFNAEDGECYADEEGVEVPDLKAASAMALRVLAEHLQSKPEHFWEHDCLKVHVADAAGLHLLTITVSAMFSPALASRSDIARPG